MRVAPWAYTAGALMHLVAAYGHARTARYHQAVAALLCAATLLVLRYQRKRPTHH